jgi:hypothetical protein
MADPRMFDTPTAVVFQEATDALQAMLGNGGSSATEANQPLSERYPGVPGSLSSLLETVSLDRQVRDTHGQPILVAALTSALNAQQRRIQELERKVDVLIKETSEAPQTSAKASKKSK